MLGFSKFDTYYRKKILCSSSTAIQTATLSFPVLCQLSPNIPLLQSSSTCFVFTYFGQQKRICSTKNNPYGLFTAEKTPMSLILSLPFQGCSGKLLEAVSEGGSCFSQGTASSITLSLTSAASRGGKESDSLKAPAIISNKATVCCFLSSEWNTPG